MSIYKGLPPEVESSCQQTEPDDQVACLALPSAKREARDPDPQRKYDKLEPTGGRQREDNR